MSHLVKGNSAGGEPPAESNDDERNSPHKGECSEQAHASSTPDGQPPEPAQDEELRGDSTKAVAFLGEFQPHGPWAIVAFDPDREERDGATFYPGEEDQLRAWLAERDGNKNLYFHVNEVDRRLNKKATKEDMKAARWLHVDVDPRKDHDIPAEQARILKAFQEPPEGIPAPTLITFSGGGYQAFWQLKNPYLLEGDTDRASDFERFNKTLEQTFGGDACHNVDRVMRLPYTVNLPGEQKRKKGRVKAIACVVELAIDRVYPLGDFKQAPETSQSTKGKRTRIDIGSGIRLVDLEQLDEWNVAARIKALIATGDLRDTEGPKSGDDSRSGWLFDCVCGLVRANVPAELIYGIITDKNWAISESVLDKKRGLDRYARRQIEKAFATVDANTSILEFDAANPYESMRRVNAALASHANAHVFDRSGELVEIVARESSGLDPDEIWRSEGHTSIRKVTWGRLQMMVHEQSAIVLPTDDGPKRIALPRGFCSAYLSNGEWSPIPRLTGISSAPTLRRDGTICATPGYDPSTGIYFALDGEWHEVSESEPGTLADALLRPFREVPFASRRDRAVHLAALLTAVLRPMLRLAPGFAYSATAYGTGKTMLAKCCGILSLGHRPPLITCPQEGAEFEKRLDSALYAGDPILIIDNVNAPLEGDKLCAMLTSEAVNVRVLCSTNSTRLTTRTLVLATGNNLALGPDMPRRMVVCHIDAGLENPQAREFDFHPEDEMLRDRRRMVMLALRLMQVAPRGRAKTVGSFEDWSIVQDAVLAATGIDPGEGLKEPDAMSTDVEDWADILRHWDEHSLGNLRTRDIARACDMRTPLGELCDLLDCGAKSKRIAKRFSKWQNRIAGGRRLIIAQSDDSRGHVWRVERLSLSGDFVPSADPPF